MSDTLPTGPDTTRNDAGPLPRGVGTHEPEVGGQVVSPYHQEGQSVLLSSLPAWQRRIVALIQRGIPIREAAEQQRVSWASIDTWTRASPAFATAIADAEAGVAIAGPGAYRSLAVAHAESMILDAVQESQGVGVHGDVVLPKDRVTNRRLVLETAGAIGAASQAQGVGASVPLSGAQVTLLVQGMTPQQLAETLRALAHAPVPTQVVEVQEPPRGTGASKEAGGGAGG